MSIKTLALKPITLPKDMQIHLTEQEDQLFELLDEGTTWMRTTKGIDTSCRIAGGWVRDKLLGSDSNDIDVALANIMGLPFAKAFVDFVGNEKGLPVKSIAKVESNPDQSKHLETAKTRVLDSELDFVNLRSEEYAEGSRIPTEVTFGTPLQDALRRDITINALFYNVHTRKVEDHTGQGLADLRARTIRTPLAPKETFTDDPLRVIRCIRFASRFGFKLVPDLKEAASHPDIQAALTQKISRERVGEELHKMLKGRDPLGSIWLIYDLGLYHQIFHIPPAISASLSSQPSSIDTSLAATSILAALLSPEDVTRTGLKLPSVHKRMREAAMGSTSASSTASAPVLNPESTSALRTETSTPAPAPATAPSSPPTSSVLPRLYLAAALTPYATHTYTDSKGKTHPATEAVIRDGLKLGVQSHYFDGVPALFGAAKLLEMYFAQDKLWKEGVHSQQDEMDTKTRVEIGLLLRDKIVHNPITGQHWALSLLFALVQELVPLWNAATDTFDDAAAATTIERYNTFVTRMEELNLPAAIDAKPILDGREVVATLSAPRVGPWTGAVLARVVEWQLAHPAGTKEECVAWLQAEREAGRISVDVASSGGNAGAKRGKGDKGGKVGTVGNTRDDGSQEADSPDGLAKKAKH